jgi:arylformamidase
LPSFLYDAATVATPDVHDISPLISPRTAVFPGDTPFRSRRLLSFSAGHHLELSSMETTVHLGAHADAPIHYHRDGVGIDRRDPLLYVGPAQVITVSGARGRRIVPSDLAGVRIEAPRLLFRTGTFPDPDQWNDDFASLSAALVEWLFERGVRLVGIDTPSIDPAEDKILETHQAVFGRDFAVLEGLVLDGVADGLYTLLAQPLKIEGADAAPVRALLIPDRGILGAFQKFEGDSR